MATTKTQYMGLIIPDLSEPGPAWATELINALETFSSHNHTPGAGALIPISALEITQDINFNNYNINALRALRLNNNSATLTTPLDYNCIYTYGGDLYYNNSTGFPIQITSGNSINASSLGGIGGDYVGSTALELYSASNESFKFWSNTDIFAKIECGPITIRGTTGANAPGVILQAPAGLSSSYNIVLPSSAPQSLKLMTMDASGIMASDTWIDNSTIGVSANNFYVMSVPRAKLVSVNYGLSASSGVTGIAAVNNAMTAVQNMSVTLTTTGKPVMLRIIIDGADHTADTQKTSQICGTNNNYDGIKIGVYRDAALVGYGIVTAANSSGYYGLNKEFSFIDTPNAGTYTYSVKVGKSITNETVYVYYYKLLAVELT